MWACLLVACAVVQWFDNKPIQLLSTYCGKEPQNTCTRWDKASKSRITIPCPKIVGQYNSYMGGVDMNDRLISYYRSRSRSKKWTIRTVFHFLDLAVANSWIQYRNDRTLLKDKAKDILQLLPFKIDVAEYLLEMCEESSSSSDSDNENNDSIDELPRKRKVTPLPSEHKRYRQAKHIPVMVDNATFSSRCRNKSCTGRSKIKCDTCNVFLCVTAKRDCFKEFHAN